jgi:hypothetical protein
MPYSQNAALNDDEEYPLNKKEGKKCNERVYYA